MSLGALVAPAPGGVTAVVPGAGDDTAAALSPVLAEAAAADRAHAVVRARPLGIGDLTASANLAASGRLPTGPARDAWLRPLGELVARLERPWAELGHAERYLLEVARARLRPVDLLVLERPGGRLAGPRACELVRELAEEGAGVLWLERRLRLVASVADAAWLLDDGELIGPLAPATLEHDPRARRLAFGGRLRAG